MSHLNSLSSTQRAVGSALDKAFNDDDGLPGDLGAIYGLTASRLPGALTALSGEVFASEHSVLIDQAFYSRQAVLARLRQLDSANSSDPETILANAGPSSASHLGGPDYFESGDADRPNRPGASSLPTTFWTQAFGAWGGIDGNSDASSVRDNLAGLLTGADIRTDGNWRMGIALG
jgi:outer membrane autotransporter protein